MINVRDFGAVGDGLADDRVAIQSAIDSATPGDVVRLPTGTYRISFAGNYWHLRAKPGVTILGDGQGQTTLLQDVVPASQLAAMLIAAIDAPQARVADLTLLGQADKQTITQWRHGVYHKNSPDSEVLRVAAREFTGDGLYFYDRSDRPLVHQCICSDNRRNGLTMGGGTTGGVFRHSTFSGNGAEQFDLEGGSPIDDGTILDCTFDSGSVSDFALTLTGHSASVMSRGWVVRGSRITGRVLILFAQDIELSGCEITSALSGPTVFVYHLCRRVLIRDCRISSTGVLAGDSPSVVLVMSTEGQPSKDVQLDNCSLSMVSPGFGVSLVGVTSASVKGCTMTGPGDSHSSGVFARVTHLGDPLQDLVIMRSSISGFGDAAVRLGGNGPGPYMQRVLVQECSLDGVASAGVSLDDYLTVRDLTHVGNVAPSGGQLTVRRPPAVTPVPWGDGQRWRMS